jgi:hypothetical protein
MECTTISTRAQCAVGPNKPSFGGALMIRRIILATIVCAVVGLTVAADSVQAQDRAYGRTWGSQNGNQDWNRFYHYPYVFYPQNFYGNEYYRSSDDMYYRYPQEMRIPVYNKKWHNPYPAGRRYHHGHQFILDIF